MIFTILRRKPQSSESKETCLLVCSSGIRFWCVALGSQSPEEESKLPQLWHFQALEGRQLWKMKEVKRRPKFSLSAACSGTGRRQSRAGTWANFLWCWLEAVPSIHSLHSCLTQHLRPRAQCRKQVRAFCLTPCLNARPGRMLASWTEHGS